MEEKKRPAAGALLILLAAASWSFSGVLGKWLTWGPVSIVGARAAIAAVLLGLSRGSFRPDVTKGNVLGAVCVTATSLLFIAANKITTAANAIVLQYAMPVFVILFSYLFYRQKPTRTDIIAVITVLAGVLLCSVEGMRAGGWLGDLLAVAAGAAFALVFFCAHMPGANASSYTYMGNLLSALLAVNLFFDKNYTGTVTQWLAAGGLGLALGMGYFFFNRGIRYVKPVTGSILSNIEPVLNPLWVFLFLGEKPGTMAIIGGIVVIAAVTVYAVRSSRQK